jgi:F-type H+-transporting ATPase subunit b
MSVLRCPIARLSLLAALVLLAAGGGGALGQEAHDHEHPEAAATEPGGHAHPHEHDGEAAAGDEPHAAHGSGAHAVDYNQPPLPGFAPGLMTLFIYSLVLFVGFLLVARLFVWKPLIAALDQREARVNQAYHEAETAKAEAEKLIAAHDARMNEVQEEVKGIVAKARQQADQEKAQIIAAAEAEAQALRDSALADIRQARDAALAQLLGTAEQQANVAAEHVIGRRFSHN